MPPFLYDCFGGRLVCQKSECGKERSAPTPPGAYPGWHRGEVWSAFSHSFTLGTVDITRWTVDIFGEDAKTVPPRNIYEDACISIHGSGQLTPALVVKYLLTYFITTKVQPGFYRQPWVHLTVSRRFSPTVNSR